MPSRASNLLARTADKLVEQFGERDGTGGLAPIVTIRTSDTCEYSLPGILDDEETGPRDGLAGSGEAMVIRRKVDVRTVDAVAAGMTQIPRRARVFVGEVEYAIDEGFDGVWGEPFVTLALVREPLSRLNSGVRDGRS